jgi:uncharacterized protein YraI
MGILMMARTSLIFILFLPVVVFAEAAQLGRVTSDVNFRKGPSTSEPVIGRLRAGEEVQVIKRNSVLWYFVVYKGQPGFVHERYIKVRQNQNFQSQQLQARSEPKHGQPDYVDKIYIKQLQDRLSRLKQFLTANRRSLVPAGLILGFILLNWVLYKAAPFLFKLEMILIACGALVLTLSLGFKLDILSALISVVLGLPFGLLLLTWRKKNQIEPPNANSYTINKAA